jgi:hypothetical protein
MAPFVCVVAVLMVLVLAPASPAQTDGLLYADDLVVVDGTGRQVGSAWPVSDSGWIQQDSFHMAVEFRLGSTPVIVHLRPYWFGPDGFMPPDLRFSGAGCTGQTLIDAYYAPSTIGWGEGWYRFNAVAGPQSTVYVQSGPIRSRTARSRRTSDGVCTELVTTQPMALLKATEIHLADHFVPPFRVLTRGQTPVPRKTP